MRLSVECDFILGGAPAPLFGNRVVMMGILDGIFYVVMVELPYANGVVHSTRYDGLAREREVSA